MMSKIEVMDIEQVFKMARSIHRRKINKAEEIYDEQREILMEAHMKAYDAMCSARLDWAVAVHYRRETLLIFFSGNKKLKAIIKNLPDADIDALYVKLREWQEGCLEGKEMTEEVLYGTQMDV